jgi:flagellar biosynthesis protein FlhA
LKVKEASTAIRERMDQHHNFVLVATPEARPYVRVARGVEVKSLGTIS